MRILHFVADGANEYNSSNFRVAIPASAIQRSGKAQVRIINVGHWLKQTDYGKYYCSWADIIVIQRVLVSESIEHAKNWITKGKAVVVDFDDAYDLIRDDNAAYPFWGEGEIEIQLRDGHSYKKQMDGNHPIQQFADGLQHITGLVTPSRLLCADWQKYTNAFYLPNYLDMPRYNKFPNVINDKLILGWGGSLSHIPSFTGSGIVEALQQLFSERDDIQFLLVGDKRVLEHLHIAPDKLIFSPYTKFSDWPGVLKRYDIGLAPLFDKYDCRRSHLKVMEYTALKMPYVATRSMVYADFMNSQSGEFVDQGDVSICDVANTEGWYMAMKRVIERYDEFVDYAKVEQTAAEYLYNVDDNVDAILRVYQEILDARSK